MFRKQSDHGEMVVSCETISCVGTPVRPERAGLRTPLLNRSEGNLRYLFLLLVSWLAKRPYRPNRLNGEGERLTGWQLWYSHGDGHLFGHMKLAGDDAC